MHFVFLKRLKENVASGSCKYGLSSLFSLIILKAEMLSSLVILKLDSKMISFVKMMTLTNATPYSKIYSEHAIQEPWPHI